MSDEQPFERIEETMKRAIGALREAGVPFLLAGSLASWARGGPPTRHDLDLVVKPEDAERALDALVQIGMQAERPVEEWLVKAWDGDVLVDLIFSPRGLEVTDELLARSEELHVLGMSIPVLALEDLLASKLLALDDHRLDLAPVLQIARALREQIDWAALRARTRGSAHADAFFALVEGLGIAAPPHAGAEVRLLRPSAQP
ncbi:MAG: nucleotidyltransferase [Solirubrobacteraceae bacterium]